MGKTIGIGTKTFMVVLFIIVLFGSTNYNRNGKHGSTIYNRNGKQNKIKNHLNAIYIYI